MGRRVCEGIEQDPGAEYDGGSHAERMLVKEQLPKERSFPAFVKHGAWMANEWAWLPVLLRALGSVTSPARDHGGQKNWFVKDSGMSRAYHS